MVPHVNQFMKKTITYVTAKKDWKENAVKRVGNFMGLFHEDSVALVFDKVVTNTPEPQITS